MDSIKGAFAGITLIFPARMNSYTSSPRLAYMTLGLSPQDLHSTCFVSSITIRHGGQTTAKRNFSDLPFVGRTDSK